MEEKGVSLVASVLNLPVFASESDIREKHRQLSLIFHPDKQRDERTKEAAQEKFLEVQKAYEILSDPFLRAVYDALGFEGLSIKWPENYRTLPPDELYPAIRQRFFDVRSAFNEANIQPRGTVTCVFDARELFRDGWLDREWYTDLSERLASSRVAAMSLKHSIRKRLGQQTSLKVISKISQASMDDDDMANPSIRASRLNVLKGNIVGIIQHQQSSKLMLEARASLLRGRVLTLTSVYSDGPTRASASVVLQPRLRSLLPPPVIVSLRQRLFRQTQTFGSVEFTLHPAAPSVSIGLEKPAVAPGNLISEEEDESGFTSPEDSGVYGGWACGFTLRLAGGGPSFYAEWMLALVKFGADVKAGLEWSLLTGLTCRLSGIWQSDEDSEEIRAQPGSRAEADVVWGLQGVQLRLDFTHNGQQFVLPISLADERAPGLALLGAVVPATAFAIFDYFALRQRRIAKRNARLWVHRQSQEGQTAQKRAEAELVVSLLADSARRNMQAEKENDGLVVIEATYFPLEDNGQPLSDLGLDVTIPVQALIHKGQLFVPAGRPKSMLRGFYDPLPECRKRMSVRYTFRGRPHYAEVGDRAALVLPLESHLVENEK